MAQETEPPFVDGEQVTTFTEQVDQLTELLTETIADTYLPVTELLADEEELSIYAEGHSNSHFPTEYATDSFQQLKDTDFYHNIELLTDWARTTHIERSIIDGSLKTGDHYGTESGVLTVTFYPTESRLASYYLRIKFSDYSAPIIKLFAQPTYYREEDSDEIHWRATDFDATEATEFLENKRPYCGSRVAELINIGCNESQAKAQALREAGLPHDEIANRLNITTNASTSYTSKLSTETENAFKRSLAVGEHPKRFLASQEFPTQERGHAKTKYVLKSIGSDTAYLITRDEYSNAHPDESVHGTVNMSTDTYDTLTSLISENQIVDHPEKISAWNEIIQEIHQEWLSKEKEILIELIDELAASNPDNIM